MRKRLIVCEWGRVTDKADALELVIVRQMMRTVDETPRFANP